MATRIVRPSQLRELSKQLRAGNHGELVAELRKAVREAAKPVLTDVQATVRALQITGAGGESTGARGGGGKARGAHAASRARTDAGRARLSGHTGLRDTMARITRVRSLARGVTIEVNAARLPEDQRHLPQDLESSKGWRHPVFGNRRVWARERGGPWFYPTVRRHQEDFHTALGQGVDRAANKLAEKVSAG